MLAMAYFTFWNLASVPTSTKIPKKSPWSMGAKRDCLGSIFKSQGASQEHPRSSTPHNGRKHLKLSGSAPQIVWKCAPRRCSLEEVIRKKPTLEGAS